MTDKVAFSNDEKVLSLFQADVLLADQFAATFRARDSLGPEKRLILAVLEEAIRCLQKFISAGGRRHRALFRDAEEWIMEENSDWPFSFENSCLALGLNPGYLRRGLMCGRGQKSAQRQNRKNRYYLQSHDDQRCKRSHKGAGTKQFTKGRIPLS